MKRFFLFLSFLTIISIAVSAQKDTDYPYSPRLVKIYDNADLDSLADKGVEVLRRRGDILLCLFPNNTTRGTVSPSLPPRSIAPTLDIAKSYYDANSIGTGAAVGTPFTGNGVVVGICDIGIDPLHPTFLDENGNSRIKRLVHYVEREGVRIQLEGNEQYKKWGTDNPDEFHATHVCGILAGDGAGTPYSGIASDADIVVTVSTLTEVGLLAGVEDIIDYAKEVGKPAVINISVGSYTGAHDGTSLFSQYLDMCADDAFIVLSAGNEGHRTNFLATDFTPDRLSVSFCLGNKDWDQFNMYGVTDIWSGSDSPLSLNIGIYDSMEKRVVQQLDSFCLLDGDTRTYEWDETSNQLEDFPFVGNLTVQGEVDAENGRHRTVLGYDYVSAEKVAEGTWARYVLAVEVSGEEGNDVEVYSDGIYTRLIAMPGNPAPSSARTISDLACGHRVISVGMYGNRAMVPTSAPAEFMDDEIYDEPTGYEAASTVRYSSYGTLRDDRVLPLTVAPGAPLVSAGSRHFFELYPYHPHLRMGGAPWVSEAGTSMSSPYVAGYIATWLEAAPDLTIEDVMRIISATNHMDIPEIDDPHNANGYFDPVKGLRMALESGGVESVENPGSLLSPHDYVSVYSVAGVKIYAGSANGLSGIEKGFYILHTPYGVMKTALPLR